MVIKVKFVHVRYCIFVIGWMSRWWFAPTVIMFVMIRNLDDR
jgi:hypothetical protein